MCVVCGVLLYLATQWMNWALQYCRSLSKNSFTTPSSALTDCTSLLHCWYVCDKVWLRGRSSVRTAYCALGFNQCLVLSGKSLTSSLCCWLGWLLKLRLDVGISEKCSVKAWSVKSLTSWDWNSLWVSLCPLAFDNPESSQQCLNWYKQVKPWEAWESLPGGGSMVSHLAGPFDQTILYTKLFLEFLCRETSS